MTGCPEHLTAVQEALQGLVGGALSEKVAALLKTLGYDSPKTLETGGDPQSFLEAVGLGPDRFERFDGGVKAWNSLRIVFQLTSDELPALARGSLPTASIEYRQSDIDSFVFLAVDLRHDKAWRRRDLVGITRELNRGFAMPAIVFFRYDNHLTLAVIDRRTNLRDAARDVVGGRISLVKDIDLANPHRAHVEIIADLALRRFSSSGTFRQLYNGWLTALSASELNKRFYRDLADWFAWASNEGVVHFPPGQGNGNGDRQIGLIRLLTRVIFVWFIKEKGLVPDEFFDERALRGLLHEVPRDQPDAHGYYLSILQNLFFACLNTDMGDRDWLPRGKSGTSAAYLVHTKLRQRNTFLDPDVALALFSNVPFLNGGLFDCLDTKLEPTDTRAVRANREGSGLVLRVDGFSEEPDRQPQLKNRLFFGGERDADLSAYYGRATYRDVPGLIELFGNYKFTIEENTPLEEDAALDPELLGKVFENLLASYNEDTKATARSKSGSFYTPREVVELMVDEALVAYLGPHLEDPSGIANNTLTAEESKEPLGSDYGLRALLSYTESVPMFSDAQTETLVAAIESCQTIDPAVGSGAFPLGLLHKLVHVLHRLDPSGAKWKASNRRALEEQLKIARQTPAPFEREERIGEAQKRLAEFDVTFTAVTADYARKLYLIERCLHGVDVQPIAVQIAKLRCFIALAVEQRVDETQPNRGVTPLPNLEMKFVAANTLGMLTAQQAQLRPAQVAALEIERRDANAEFFSARDARTKERARMRIGLLRKKLSAVLAEAGFPADDAGALAAWDPFDANAAATFFDPEWMFGLPESGGGYFDIVLSNPPYVRHEKIEDYQLAGHPANTKALLRSNYATFTGTADLYVYFFERSVRLLKTGGAIAFITSNKWYRAAYGARLRRWLGRKVQLDTVIDFGDADVFDAIAYPTIVVARRLPEHSGTLPVGQFRALLWPSPTSTSDAKAEGIRERLSRDGFEMRQSELTSGTDWQIIPLESGDILRKLRGMPSSLQEFLTSEIHRGITTGFNPAFEIDDMVRAELEQDRSAELLKPLLKGRDVRRWSNERPSRWIIFARRGVEIEQYPLARRHLAKFKSQLEPKPKNHIGTWHGRKAGTYKWWEIQDNVNYWPIFEDVKIISNKVTDKPTFSLDSDGNYLGNTTYCFTCRDYRYVLAVLNSSVSAYVSARIFVDKEGGFYEVQPTALAAFPIPVPLREQEELINVVVDALVAGAGSSALLESLINAFVYELFLPDDLAARGLSPSRVAHNAGLHALQRYTGRALADEADEWSRILVDPGHALYSTLFEVQSIDAVRVIEGRE